MEETRDGSMIFFPKLFGVGQKAEQRSEAGLPSLENTNGHIAVEQPEGTDLAPPETANGHVV